MNEKRSIKVFSRNNHSVQLPLSWVKENPNLSIVEFDTVEGRKGGKVLLTINITTFDILLVFIRDHNDAHSVHHILDDLKQKLGLDLFCKLFAIGLTDRGSEFTSPTRIEANDKRGHRTKVFYCDPGMPQQKPKIENAHLLLRRVLPRFASFDDLTQQDIDLIVSHINSYSREKLNNLSPHKLFSSIYSPEILQVLNIREIDPQDINLTPSLLR